jgi:hypothetical protein
MGWPLRSMQPAVRELVRSNASERRRGTRRRSAPLDGKPIDTWSAAGIGAAWSAKTGRSSSIAASSHCSRVAIEYDGRIATGGGGTAAAGVSITRP